MTPTNFAKKSRSDSAKSFDVFVLLVHEYEDMIVMADATIPVGAISTDELLC